MWRPIEPTSVTRHQLVIRMSRNMMMTKTYARQVIGIKLIKKSNNNLQSCDRKKKAMFTNHKGASLTLFIFYNLFISLSLTISFHVFYSHFNWFNKIDI